MADPQTADQGFLPGLLGKVGGWFGSSDPAAEYGGLLSDPATRNEFRLRSLGAAAQAFGQGAMPVPYKGGIPLGATLGSAGGAAATAGDALMAARLQAAQAQLAGYQGQLAEANVHALGMNNQLYPVALGMEKGVPGTGTGTGTSGTALTGPAKIIADSKGTVFDTGDPFLNLVAHHESGFRPNIGWGDTDLSGYKLNANGFPDWPGKPGPQGNSTAAGLFQITGTNWNKYAPPLIAAGVMKPDFSPESQIAVAKSMMAANGKSDWLPYNPALAAAYNRGDVVKVPGSAASPQTAGPPTATQPPAPTPQQTANGPPTGLVTPLPGGALPPGSEGATPGPLTGLLAPRPPGAGPIPPTIARNSAGQPYQPIGPGGAVAAGTPGAASVITPQQAAAANAAGGNRLPVMPSDDIFGKGQVAPPGAGSVSPDVAGPPPPQAAPGPVGGLLSPAAAAIAQGMANAGALQPSRSVAGPGAPSEPPAADAAAARAAAMGQESSGLPGLLAQQPPPQAPAAGPVPPSAAPAPAPAGPMPPAPGGAAPPGVAPPMPPPVMPPMPPQPVAPAAALGPIAGAPTDRQIAAASIIAHNNIMMGKAVPPDIAAILNYKYAGPTAAATAAATAPITRANAAYEAQVKAQYQAWVDQNKPREIRAGGMSVEPGTGRVIQNPATIQTTDPRDGSEHAWSVYPATTPGGIPTYRYIGMTKVGPGTTTTLTNTAGAQPIAVGNQVTGTGPGYTQPLKTVDGSFLPPASSAAPITGSKDYLDTRSKQFADTEDNWGKSVGSAQEAMQRTQAIMTAMKLYQTGAFATDTSDLVAALKAAHIDLGNKVNDPAQAQIILKDAFGQALSGMQATGLSKWTQAELFGQLKNLANPDLQPAANREIGAQTIGTLQWEQQMQKDFARYKQFSPGINDPTDFQRRWVEANPLQPFIDKARTQVGPLKGETPDLPAGAMDTGRTYQGKPIYNVPDGKGGFKQQVLH